VSDLENYCIIPGVRNPAGSHGHVVQPSACAVEFLPRTVWHNDS